jgi:hypothetical protein
MKHHSLFRKAISCFVFGVWILLPAFCEAALTWENKEIEITAQPGEGRVVGVFHFTNSGDASITITEIKPSCDCTTVDTNKRTYARGEKGEIKALVYLRGVKGPQEKSISITTDNPSLETVKLTLRINRSIEENRNSSAAH